MLVKELKEMLEHYDDESSVAIDNGEQFLYGFDFYDDFDGENDSPVIVIRED